MACSQQQAAKIVDLIRCVGERERDDLGFRFGNSESLANHIWLAVSHDEIRW
jgi:hypothetical protein